jgi:hypothetical protein
MKGGGWAAEYLLAAMRIFFNDRFSTLALGFALTLFIAICGDAAIGDATTQNFWSPHHRYCCHIQEGKLWGGESVLFEAPQDHKSKMLLTTPRWAEVFWSPDGAWFCLDDNWDPDNNRLHVYHVLHDGTTEEVWSSFEVSPDSYWTVLGWRMDQGTIHVQCDYAIDYSYKEKGSLTKAYFVPIFLPQQVTVEEQFIRAEAGMKNSKRK